MVKSLMSYPLDLLRGVFPYVDKYYSNSSSHIDFYQHVYGGVILSLIAATFSSLWIFIISILVHVVVKEIVYDMFYLRKDFNAVDLTTRIYGFVLGLPFVLFSL